MVVGMPTLIVVHGAGQCDARCYDAEMRVCDCVCQGMNHGAGFEKAVAQTRACAKEWIEKSGGGLAEIFGKPAEQGDLFAPS